MTAPNTSLVSSFLWKQAACQQPSHNANIIKSILYSLHSYFVSTRLQSCVISPMRKEEITVMKEAKQIFEGNLRLCISDSVFGKALMHQCFAQGDYVFESNWEHLLIWWHLPSHLIVRYSWSMKRCSYCIANKVRKIHCFHKNKAQQAKKWSEN